MVDDRLAWPIDCSAEPAQAMGGIVKCIMQCALAKQLGDVGMFGRSPFLEFA